MAENSFNLDPLYSAYRRALSGVTGYGAASPFTDWLKGQSRAAVGTFLGGTLMDPNRDPEAFFREYLNRLARGEDLTRSRRDAAENLDRLLSATDEPFRARLPPDAQGVTPWNPRRLSDDQAHLDRLQSVREALKSESTTEGLLSSLLSRPYGSYWDYTPQALRRAEEDYGMQTGPSRIPYWSYLLRSLGVGTPYGPGWVPSGHGPDIRRTLAPMW